MSDSPQSASVPPSMKVAIYRGRGEIDVESTSTPTLAADDVLLRISHCGICGTDLHLVMDGWGRPNTTGGHEYSGEVVALGSAVTGWEIGDAAVGGPGPRCGICEGCLAHRPSLCDASGTPGANDELGAFAEFKRVPAAQLIRIPDGLSLRDAALCEPLAVALHGITQSGIAAGQRALITGAGPVGTLTLAALRAKGVDDVTVSEPAQSRRDLARSIGATSVIEPDVIEIPPMPFTVVDNAYHVAFECSGKAVALRGALAQLKKGGTLVILGTGMEQPALDGNRVLLNELTVTGAYNYDENGFAEALELLASGRLAVDRLVDGRDVPLEGLISSMRSLVAGEIAGKVLVRP
ncbi:MAG: alcohol dehydrogenase catalytic domain-containing protein [Myxococcota bacterium]